MTRTSNATMFRARELRRSMSLPEGMLWQVLRTRPDGFRFRRQHPLGSYVADFCCPAARLVIEVDGSSHGMGDRPNRDARREAWMREQGFKILRANAGDIMRNLDGVVRAIVAECSA